MARFVNRVMIFHVGPDHPAYADLDVMAYRVRHLYNKMLHDQRQAFFDPDRKMEPEGVIRKRFTRDRKDLWSAGGVIPAKVARETSIRLGNNFKSMFAKLAKGASRKEAGLPKYYKGDARASFTVPKDALTKGMFTKGEVGLSKVSAPIGKISVPWHRVTDVKVVPVRKGFEVHVGWKKTVRSCPSPDQQDTSPVEKYAGGDLGVDNIITVACDDADVQPLIVSGRYVKSVNQGAHKFSSGLKSALPTGVKSSRQVRAVWDNRNRTVTAELHRMSRAVVDYCVTNGVTTLVIGWNEGLKTDPKTVCGMGRVGNQNFRSLPWRKLVDLITYKAAEQGIEVVETEESYTSKTSVLDGELPYQRTAYAGRRVKRGLFKSSKGILINADVNGACQIVRKCKPDAFSWADGVVGKAGNGADAPQPTGLLRPVRV